MSPAVIGILALLGYKMLGPKGAGAGGGGAETPGETTSSKPDLVGAPTLEISKIHKIPFDKVDFVLSAGGSDEKGEHKANKVTPTTIRSGDYMAVAVTDPKIREGQKKPDAVVIAVKDRSNKVIMAKRILINDKEIVDLV